MGVYTPRPRGTYVTGLTPTLSSGLSMYSPCQVSRTESPSRTYPFATHEPLYLHSTQAYATLGA